jgi:hypothetical protein
VAARRAGGSEGSRAPAVDAIAAGSADEYPNSVQELAMNGFDLSRVLRAYDLVGDNFDDMLSFLLSSASRENEGAKWG